MAPKGKRCPAVFISEIGEGEGGLRGQFSEQQFRKLSTSVKSVADELLRAKKITQEQRDRIDELYNVDELIRKARENEPFPANSADGGPAPE